MIEATFKPVEVNDSIPLREATEGYWVVTQSDHRAVPLASLITVACGRVMELGIRPGFVNVRLENFNEHYRVRPVRDGEALVFGNQKGGD